MEPVLVEKTGAKPHHIDHCDYSRQYSHNDDRNDEADHYGKRNSGYRGNHEKIDGYSGNSRQCAAVENMVGPGTSEGASHQNGYQSGENKGYPPEVDGQLLPVRSGKGQNEGQQF